MPYLLALADQNARTGDPLMRPLFYDYPDALKLSCDAALTFTIGRDLVVASPARPESPQPQSICLPSGGWYDYWTGALVGEHKFAITPELDKLPIFVRAGTILPRQPLVQSTMETPTGPLELEVYPGPECKGELYLDDGVSVGGARLRQNLQCSVTSDGVIVRFGARSGSYRPWWNKIAITVHGPRGGRTTIADHPNAGEIRIGTTSS
jgi:alpha-glucosidase